MLSAGYVSPTVLEHATASESCPAGAKVPAVHAMASTATTALLDRTLSVLLSQTGRARCSSRKRSDITINDCMNLAPAGTGTTAIFQRLRAATDLHRWEHHEHRIGMPNSSAPLRSWTAKGDLGRWNVTIGGTRRPPCVIMTLRDPVSRLQSGAKGWVNGGHALPGTRGVHAFWRGRPKNAPFDWLHWLLAKSPTPSAGSSAPRSCCPYPGQCCSADLDVFFVPQVSTCQAPYYIPIDPHPRPPPAHSPCLSQVRYLANIDCDADEVHFVCTERLEDDWNRIRLAFGIPINAHGSTQSSSTCAGAKTARTKLACGNVHSPSTDKQVSRLPEGQAAVRINRTRDAMAVTVADERLIRQCAWRLDAILHERLCGGRPVGRPHRGLRSES